ncbi:MAG: DUF1080 domain-containing protein [Acidobacteriota bacterium]
MTESTHRRAYTGLVLVVLALCAGITLTLLAQHPGDLGFDDTPYLPGGKWRVHDSKRPRPTVITPGTCSTQDQPGRPPSDAIVLFDGKDLSQWQNLTAEGKLQPAAWKVADGYMEVVGGTGSLVTKQKFGDCQLHIEWASPAEVKGNSQGRGNSGVILMGHYEIQVLDTYDNLTYADGGASAMYGQFPPLVNACRKPGQWQTYDIIFEAPKFDGDKVVKPAYVTVLHNGVVVHNHQAFIGAMVWRQLATYHPHPAEEPLMLQDHGNPVRYRNIWIRSIGTYN